MASPFRELRRMAVCRRCSLTPILPPRGLCASCEVDLSNADRLLSMPVTLDEEEPVPFVEPRMKIRPAGEEDGLYIVAEIFVIAGRERAVLRWDGGWSMLFSEHVVSDGWLLTEEWTGRRTQIGEAYVGGAEQGAV